MFTKRHFRDVSKIVFAYFVNCVISFPHERDLAHCRILKLLVVPVIVSTTVPKATSSDIVTGVGFVATGVCSFIPKIIFTSFNMYIIIMKIIKDIR